MNGNRRLTAGLGLVLALSIFIGGLAPGGLAAPEGVQGEVADSLLDKLLTFIHSAANMIGKGLVQLVEMIADVDVSELQEALGYLGILTASLVIFGALKAAQKIIWFIVLLGWGLIAVRIVLEALDKSPVK